VNRVAALLAGLLLVPATAAAHVKPKVPEAPAGARFTFSFLVDHGCEGSPTTGLSIQLPEGAFDARPVAKPGWTAQVVEAAVDFAGGPLPDETKDSFSVELVTPNRPGEDVFFPTVQRCQVGATHWIAPQAEAENAAPRVRLTPNPSPITAPPPTTTTTAPATPPTTIQSAARPSGDSGGSGPTAVLLLGAVAIGASGWLLLRRRARSRIAEL
jgi:periplasmic copper chaperone A